ncbi:MAG: glycerol-3-phosphate acyltransferase, partial [Pseudomonadota bacterium]|nr:glycerol-3-phosphate acyltransferase [Pseudomonadota bacterium]
MPDPISWSQDLPYFAAGFLFAYLLGSIPFGLVLTKFSGAGDIRE